MSHLNFCAAPRMIGRHVREGLLRIWDALENLLRTSIAVHQMLLTEDGGPNKLWNLERYAARHSASRVQRWAAAIPVTDTFTSHLPYQSADGWRCLLCSTRSKRYLDGRCPAPLFVNVSEVWQRVREESRRPARTHQTGTER